MINTINKKKLVVAFSLLATNVAMACSSAMFPVYDGDSVKNTLVVRTMDFEVEAPFYMLYAKAKDQNTSDVNINKDAMKHSVKWENKYNIVGKGMSLNKLVDGINAAGLKVGGLFAPGTTTYPEYDSTDKRPALSVFDVVNYVLGTSSNTKEAIENLRNVQVVVSAITIGPVAKTVPLHYHIIDKTGDSAVVEFINGEMVITENAPVLTNSPTYAWQVNNYSAYEQKLERANTNTPTDGIYMNGSGYAGIPGDTTPPARFVKASYLMSSQPIARNDSQAMYSLESVFNYALFVPVGANPAVTLWRTVANLSEGTYEMTNYIEKAVEKHYQILGVDNKRYHNVYDVKTLTNTDKDIMKHAILKAATLPAILKDKQPSLDTSANIGVTYDGIYGLFNSEQPEGDYEFDN